MSKGLEALKEIKSEPFSWEKLKDSLEIIEKELKEYEEMKRIKGTTTLDNALEETLIKACPNVSKKLKALEIIKEHTLYCENVDCFVFVNVTKEVNEFLKEVLL